MTDTMPVYLHQKEYDLSKHNPRPAG